MDERFTALCGLCCPDCIPANERFFTVVKELEGFLIELQFEHYAELKSRNNPVFTTYPNFVQVLEQVKNLQCIVPCTEGGGAPHCGVRECAFNKGIRGCWECKVRKDCHKLEPVEKIHPNVECHLE